MTDITVLNADGDRIAVALPLAPGRAAAAASKPMALSTEDLAAINAITAALGTNHADLVALEALLPAAFAANGGLKTGHPDVRPVSGTITTVDSGSSSASGQNSVSIVTGSPSANSTHHQAINGQSTARVQVSGTWTGTLTFEGSMDGGTTYVPQTARVTGTVFAASSVTANGMFTIDTAGLTDLRVRATAAMTGTATVQMALSTEAGFVQVTNPQRLVDNVSGASATIKPASTAPATTDTAVVTGIADGNHVTFGSKTDNKSTATDSTAVTAMQVLKQISFSIQAAATSLAALVTGTVLAAGAALIGRAVADASAATGGIASTARLPSAAASTNATNVKVTAGRVYSASGKNNAAYDVFLVLYDALTNPPVPGTTTIRKKIVCPAGQAFVYDWPVGLSFATGIGYAFTKLVADADTTALVAADITAFNLDYV